VSLSIFSFKKEFLVIGLVVVGLLIAELVLRRSAQSSMNFRKISGLQADSEFLSRNEKGKSVIVLGNSLTLRGIEEESVEANPQHGVRLVAMQGSFITEWKWIFANHFADENIVSLLVINSDVNSLSDDSDVRLERIARSFPSLVSTVKAWDDFNSVKQVATLSASNQSLLFSWRKQLGASIQQKIVPHYELGQNAIAKAGKRESSDFSNLDDPDFDGDQLTFHTFESVCTLAKENNIKVVVVLLPTRDSYEIHSDIQNTACSILDLRNQPELKDKFADKVHLTEEGKEIFSPVYSKAIQEHLNQLDYKRN